jgi:cobalamin synthase
VVLFLSSFAVLVYNISGMYVTEQVGAAARTVLENARTLLVWLVSKVQHAPENGMLSSADTSEASAVIWIHLTAGMCLLVYCAVRFACVQALLLLLVLPLLLQAALGLYYMHVGESGGAGGQGVTIGEAWDSWSWLQVGRQPTSQHFLSVQWLAFLAQVLWPW